MSDQYEVARSRGVATPRSTPVEMTSASSEPFDCAVCQRSICRRWNGRGRDKQLPPICNWCEADTTFGKRAPHAGSFRDRREAVRILALANALNAEAHSQQWRWSYGRA